MKQLNYYVSAKFSLHVTYFQIVQKAMYLHLAYENVFRISKQQICAFQLTEEVFCFVWQNPGTSCRRSGLWQNTTIYKVKYFPPCTELILNRNYYSILSGHGTKNYRQIQQTESESSSVTKRTKIAPPARTTTTKKKEHGNNIDGDYNNESDNENDNTTILRVLLPGACS